MWHSISLVPTIGKLKFWVLTLLYQFCTGTQSTCCGWQYNPLAMLSLYITSAKQSPHWCHDRRGSKSVIKPKSLYHFVPRSTVGAWDRTVCVWCLLSHRWTGDVSVCAVFSLTVDSVTRRLAVCRGLCSYLVPLAPHFCKEPVSEPCAASFTLPAWRSGEPLGKANNQP